MLLEEMQESFDSEDLIELSKFYEKQENFKSLKSQIAESKKNKVPANTKILK